MRPVSVDSRFSVEGEGESGDGYQSDSRETDCDSANDGRFALLGRVGQVDPDSGLVVIASGRRQTWSKIIKL